MVQVFVGRQQNAAASIIKPLLFLPMKTAPTKMPTTLALPPNWFVPLHSFAIGCVLLGGLTPGAKAFIVAFFGFRDE
jgi:hypothetical protein